MNHPCAKQGQISKDCQTAFVQIDSPFVFRKEPFNMKGPQYSNSVKLHWYPDLSCPICGRTVNSWDKRCRRALGYRHFGGG